VPLDEHPWIESEGCTSSYRELRNRIRGYYRDNYPLTEAARGNEFLNPGNGWVSRLCSEPRVAVAVIDGMLAPYRANLQLEVLIEHRPASAATNGDVVSAVTFLDTRTGDDVVITADYVLDATELGDLLELAGVEHVIGAESRSETNELHALDGAAQPLDQQGITWCFAMDYQSDGDFTIDKPADYAFWQSFAPDFWPAPLLSWTDVNPETLEQRTVGLFNDDTSARGGSVRDRWNFRRMLTTEHFASDRYSSDTTLVNWPQNDYWLGPILGVPAEEAAANLNASRQMSLSLLYWMQTEAPRHDGGTGYPGLRLRGDLLGTTDGLAMRPYIRESRRIRAAFTTTEQHVGVEARREAGLPAGAERFTDSVGVGSYRIDLHPSTAGRSYIDIASYPFQIPLGSLIPVRANNLLPAAKNVGTTHITNGCYRLHPVEWNIGEAAGALAAYCLETGKSPRAVHEDVFLTEDFQHLLETRLGVQLDWSSTVQDLQKERSLE
jgi:hypothetical protein